MVQAVVSMVRWLELPATPEQVTVVVKTRPGLLAAQSRGLAPLIQVQLVLRRDMEPRVQVLEGMGPLGMGPLGMGPLDTGPLPEDSTEPPGLLLVAVTASTGKPMLFSTDTGTGSMDPSTVPRPRATGSEVRELVFVSTASVIHAAATVVTVLGLWITGIACSAVCLAGRCHPEPAVRVCLWLESITWSTRTSLVM